MIIRKFLDSDAVGLARMHRATIKTVNSNDYPKEQIRVWAGGSSAKKFRERAKDSIILVALEKNKLVGFIESKYNDLKGLYIHRDYIGQGVGKKLLKKLQETAYKQGIRKLKCMSTITAIYFYAKHGFKIIKKTKYKIRKQKLTVYEMEKKLKPQL